MMARQPRKRKLRDFPGKSVAQRTVEATGIGPFAGRRVGTPVRAKPKLAQPGPSQVQSTIRRALKSKVR